MNFISTFDELNKLYEEDNSKAKKSKRTCHEGCCKEELTEAADEDIVDEVFEDEHTDDEEIEIVDDEPKQVVVECSKCGALAIKNIADIVTDEETGLINMEDSCEYCEESEGYKIIGTMLPYEESKEEEIADDAEEASTEESPAEEAPAEKAGEEVVEEDLADAVRKTFDIPASERTQQSWEARLNGELGEISDAERERLEKKFAQQRDWEARHGK